MIVQHFNCPIICYDIFCSITFLYYFVHLARLLSSHFFFFFDEHLIHLYFKKKHTIFIKTLCLCLPNNNKIYETIKQRKYTYYRIL